MNEILSKFLDIIQDLQARDPIRPECRRASRLFPSDWVERGQVYRLAPQPGIVGHDKPLIVMSRLDVEALRMEWAQAGAFPGLDVDQEIADCCEQLFVDRAKESKP